MTPIRKILLLFAICTIAFAQPQALFGQNPTNPPPTELTNDQMIQKAQARYSISPGEDGLTFLQVSFLYEWKVAGKKYSKLASLEGYTLYLFQTTPRNRTVWTGGDNFIFGVIESPPASEFAVWVLFNPKNPTGNIRTGHIRIR